MIGQFLGETPLCGDFAYSDRFVCLSVVCRVVYYGKTVQDRPKVCIEVAQECDDDISIGTILDTP